MKNIRLIADAIISTKASGKKIFIVGNGGSATTATHMVTDLSSLSKKFDYHLCALSLVDSISTITAIGNDYEFENIFSHQLERLGKPGDLLIVFSASGNSLNLISAVNRARYLGIESIAVLGFDGGHLKQLVNSCILVESEIGDYGPVEDIHLMIAHIVKELIIEDLVQGKILNE